MPFFIVLTARWGLGAELYDAVMMTDEMKSHFMNLYNMVLADGNVKPEELVQVYRIGLRHGVSPGELNQLLLSPVKSTLPDALEKKISNLYDLTEIILVDGEVSENEVDALRRYCILFGFKDENANAIADFMLKKVKEGHTLDDIIKEVKEG